MITNRSTLDHARWQIPLPGREKRAPNFARGRAPQNRYANVPVASWVSCVDAITAVAAGRSLLDPDVTGKVLERLRESRAEDPALASLTEQERKVLSGLAEGKTNREIGDALFLSEKTAKNYVSRILDKLGLSRRAEAAAYTAKHKPRL
ncbi:MAG: response regulator transcription factor [Chloroflexota bacterium]|nr:response regulator transcription factor [Chloroflexota bacterium]